LKKLKAKYLFTAFIAMLLLACNKENKHPINFYYWKTDVSLGKTEQKYFNHLNSQKLYIRFFDVDNNGDGIKPIAKIKKFDTHALNAQYIPVIFITNRCFSGISEPQAQQLAQNIHKLISQTATAIDLPPIKEIQIDCDWTESTRNRFFYFLTELKKTAGTDITCTLRLHQIAYKEKTGIPPVSKGYLMCYATSQPKDFESLNSILDISLLQKYTKNINSYPLSFDVALPLYSWAVVKNHLGKIKLINGVTKKDIEENPHFTPSGNNTFEVNDDIFFHGIYLNKGFNIKIENISPTLLNNAKSYLNNHIKKDYDIVYYHLDQPFLEQFTIEDLK
jgi:hypothetical protein